jgi:hypothetical protein
LGSVADVGLHIAVLNARGYLRVKRWLREIANGYQLSESTL